MVLMSKRHYVWFNGLWDSLKDEYKETTSIIKNIKFLKKTLLDNLKSNKVNMDEFTKTQALYNKRLYRLKVKARHLNVARTLIAGGDVGKAMKKSNCVINEKSVLDIIVHTLGFNVWDIK